MPLPATPISLLVKLGSLVVHTDEFLSPLGRPVDRTAVEQLLRDPEVTTWVAAMTKLAMLPVRRTEEDARLEALKHRKARS